MQMNKRLVFIDNTKAILIILVVLIHVLNYANPVYSIRYYTPIQALIASFCMPAFFIISGILFKNDTWRARPWSVFFLSRVKTLLIPYLFFETIAILYKHFVLHTISISEGVLAMVTLRCNVGADWFLPAMFLASLLYLITVKHENKPLWTLVALAAILIGRVIPLSGSVWSSVYRGLIGFGYIYIGHLLKNLLCAESNLKTLISVLVVIVGSAVGLKLGQGDIYNASVWFAPVYFFTSLSGTYLTLLLSQHIHWKWMQVVGENTLPIMGTHQLVLYTVPSSSSPVWVLGMLILISVAELIFVTLTNRICPFLIGKK